MCPLQQKTFVNLALIRLTLAKEHDLSTLQSYRTLRTISTQPALLQEIGCLRALHVATAKESVATKKANVKANVKANPVTESSASAALNALMGSANSNVRHIPAYQLAGPDFDVRNCQHPLLS